MNSNKYVYVIFGPKASGNQFIRQILINAGCEHLTDFDNKFPSGIKKLSLDNSKSYVFHHHHEAQYIYDMIINEGHIPFFIFPVRDGLACQCGQIRLCHNNCFSQAAQHINSIYQMAANLISENDLNFMFLSYESLILNIESQQSFCESLGLKLKDSSVIKAVNSNKKYYDDNTEEALYKTGKTHIGNFLQTKDENIIKQYIHRAVTK